jgi:hypothetical protein
MTVLSAGIMYRTTWFLNWNRAPASFDLVAASLYNERVRQWVGNEFCELCSSCLAGPSGSRVLSRSIVPFHVSPNHNEDTDSCPNILPGDEVYPLVAGALHRRDDDDDEQLDGHDRLDRVKFPGSSGRGLNVHHLECFLKLVIVNFVAVGSQHRARDQAYTIPDFTYFPGVTAPSALAFDVLPEDWLWSALLETTVPREESDPSITNEITGNPEQISAVRPFFEVLGALTMRHVGEDGSILKAGDEWETGAEWQANREWATRVRDVLCARLLDEEETAGQQILALRRAVRDEIGDDELLRPDIIQTFAYVVEFKDLQLAQFCRPFQHHDARPDYVSANSAINVLLDGLRKIYVAEANDVIDVVLASGDGPQEVQLNEFTLSSRPNFSTGDGAVYFNEYLIGDFRVDEENRIYLDIMPEFENMIEVRGNYVDFHPDKIPWNTFFFSPPFAHWQRSFDKIIQTQLDFYFILSEYLRDPAAIDERILFTRATSIWNDRLRIGRFFGDHQRRSETIDQTSVNLYRVAHVYTMLEFFFGMTLDYANGRVEAEFPFGSHSIPDQPLQIQPPEIPQAQRVFFLNPSLSSIDNTFDYEYLLGCIIIQEDGVAVTIDGWQNVVTIDRHEDGTLEVTFNPLAITYATFTPAQERTMAAYVDLVLRRLWAIRLRQN